MQATGHTSRATHNASGLSLHSEDVPRLNLQDERSGKLGGGLGGATSSNPGSNSADS